MREHVFLCGLSSEQRHEFPAGTAISFEKGAGKLNLKLDRMRKRLAGSEPKRLTDFIQIASYVFAADRTTSRGPLDDPGVGAEWRRNFRMVVAVQEVAFWERPDVKAALSDALGFLSEDAWTFQFAENLFPIPLQQFLGLKSDEPSSGGATSVVLFSGGLDSLAGAVHELRTSNRHLVLVSHCNLPTVGLRQKTLAGQLARDFARRVTHVWVDSSLSDEISPTEETQRTRTFFFTAIGAVAAHIETSDRIQFYENGVMSVNLPFVTQLVGARSSRSTHPRSLQLLARLVNLVSRHSIEIDNPFICKTKVDVVRDLADTPQAGLIKGTISCSRSQYAIRKFIPHCGTCVQCLQRRISTLAAGAGELDERDGYETDFLEGPREKPVDRVMAVETIAMALDCSTISDRDFLSRFADPLAHVLQAYPIGETDRIAQKMIELFRRHGDAVKSILRDAISSHATKVLERSLPSSSLLALVMKERLVSVELPQIASSAPTKLPEPKPDRQEDSQAIYIAVDEVRQSILISDRPELRGPTIFPLMKMLIEAAVKDQADGRLPKNYRSFRGKAFADALGASDVNAISAAIKRARAELSEAGAALQSFDAGNNTVIESTGRGYRLNPNVRVVSSAEFKLL